MGQLTSPKVNVLQYSPKDIASAKSTMVVMMGSGQVGPDSSKILLPAPAGIAFARNLDSGLKTPDRNVLLVSTPDKTGFWGNVMDEVMDYAAGFNKDIDFGGLSLGAISAFADLPTYINKYKIRSLFTFAGRVEMSLTMHDALKKIPSRHYYDPADGTVQYGYGSVRDAVALLKSEGKTDIDLVTLNGFGHDVWDIGMEGGVDKQGNKVIGMYDWLDQMDLAAAGTKIPLQVYRVGNDLFAIGSDGQSWKLATE